MRPELCEKSGMSPELCEKNYFGFLITTLGSTVVQSGVTRDRTVARFLFRRGPSLRRWYSNPSLPARRHNSSRI